MTEVSNELNNVGNANGMSVNKSEMIDSIEQEKLNNDMNSSEVSVINVDSDDSIELSDKVDEELPVRMEPANKSKPLKKTAQSTGKKSNLIMNKSKEYLIQNLNNSQHEKIRMNSDVNSSHEQYQKSKKTEIENDEKSTTENLDENQYDQTNLTNTDSNEIDAPSELVTSICSNSSQSSNPTLRQKILSASPNSQSALSLKSASPKHLGDKMSPGLAKRIQSCDDNSHESPTIILTNESLGNSAIYTNGKKLSKSLVTSTCSSSSSTNATITPASSSNTSSSNSFHSTSNGQNNANAKIQNALDRNMQKLDIAVGQNSLKSKNSKVNLTKEEMELFESNGNMLKAGCQQQEYFSGDSLSSTPEHQVHQNRQSLANNQIKSEYSEHQEFVLNPQSDQDLKSSSNHQKNVKNQLREQQIPKELINPSQRFIERNSLDREMTPDSINNDYEVDEHSAFHNNRKNKPVNQNTIQQKKKIPASQRVIDNRLPQKSNAHPQNKLELKSRMPPQKLTNSLGRKINGNTASSKIVSLSKSSNNIEAKQQNKTKTTRENVLQHNRIQASNTIPVAVKNPARSNPSNRTINGTVSNVPKVNMNKVQTSKNKDFLIEIGNDNNQNQQTSNVTKKNSLGNKKIMNSTENRYNDQLRKSRQSAQTLMTTTNMRNFKSQQNSLVDHSKIMPVVDEGLSNDELDFDEDQHQVVEEYEDDDDQNYYNETNRNENLTGTPPQNNECLIQYDDDQEKIYHNEAYDENEYQEDEEYEEDEEDAGNEEEEHYEEYEEEFEDDEFDNDDENYLDHEHAHEYRNASNKKIQSPPFNHTKNNFVDQIQNTISAQSKINKSQNFRNNNNYSNNSVNSNNNNINGSKRGDNFMSPSNRIIKTKSADDYDTDEETNNLLENNLENNANETSLANDQDSQSNSNDEIVHEQKNREINVRQIMDPDNQVLIEGVLFRARYLGSTQLITDGNPTKLTRMLQAQEAVGRIKAPDGESQPCTEVDLFVSTEKIMVLNTDLQEIMMDHSLRSISYIADIGNLVVLMAKRRAIPQSEDCAIKKQVKMICHVFESDEAQIVAQSIGQAFQVAYMEYLKANGIEDMSIMKDLDYQEVLNQQEIMGDELGMFAKKECQKEVIIPKAKNEMLGVVIVESGWGSMLPTVVVANMMPTGPAARCGNLNIGDQIISLNGISMVGLPITACQNQIKAAKNLTLVRLVVVPCPPVVEVLIKRPDTKYQLGFSVQDGIICSLLRGGIAERGGVRVGHRIIEINNQSVVATNHEKIVNILANSVGELRMKTMPTQMFRLLTGQEQPVYI